MNGSFWTRRGFLGALGGFAGVLWLGAQRWAWAVAKSMPPLRVVFFTDVHARTEWETPTALKRAADAINAENPDLVIAGGDLITEGFESAAQKLVPRWGVYMENLHQRVHAPVEPAIGNHDLVAAHPADGSPPAENPRAEFLAQMKLDRTWRSVDWGGVHWIFLDAIRVGGHQFQYEGLVPDEQLTWLEADLASVGPDAPCVVVTHIPFLTSLYQATQGGGTAAPANRVITNTHEVLPLFQNRNVVAVLQGHLHVNEMLRWRDTTFITGGAICGRWWRGEWHGTREGFGVLTLEGKHVAWRYVEYGWKAVRPPDA